MMTATILVYRLLISGLVWLVLVPGQVRSEPSDIVHLPCREANNFNTSSCLFAGDYCDFNANFSLFYDQATPYAKYVQNPIPEHAEFVVESGTPRVQNGTLAVSLVPPRDGSTRGVATIVSTTRFLQYGVFEARFKVSGHGGVVTSFIGFANEKDEIDLEITGYDNVSVQANWYYRGLADVFASNGSSVNGYLGKTNRTDQYHTYTVNWTSEAITWSIDGQLMHDSLKNVSGAKGFPNMPMRISFGIWQAQENSTWAGLSNINDWTQPISTGFESLRVSCLAGPHKPPNATVDRQLTHAPTGYNPDEAYSATSGSVRIVAVGGITIVLVLLALVF